MLRTHEPRPNITSCPAGHYAVAPLSDRGYDSRIAFLCGLRGYAVTVLAALCSVLLSCCLGKL